MTVVSGSECKRSCCWTPFQVCGLKNQCGCHANPNGHRTLIRAQLYMFETLKDETRKTR